MKITHITAQAYLGASAVDLAITTPVTLIAGKNGAGKSSLPETITPVWIEGGVAGEMREAA